MPMNDGHYVAPTWVNYGPPALDADELNAISGTLENLDLSQGDIAAPYSKMGLTGTPTIGASLGVLADIGNVHVWRKTSVSESPYYELGPIESVDLLGDGHISQWSTVRSSDSVSVANDGKVSLSNPSTGEWIGYAEYGSTPTGNYNFTGKFIQVTGTHESDTTGTSNGSTPVTFLEGVYFIPSDAVISQTKKDSNVFKVQCNKAQKVVGYKAGTHVTYLTSTNRNAYQEGDDEVPAKYMLGDIHSGDSVLVEWGWVKYKYSNEVKISGDSLVLASPSTITIHAGPNPVDPSEAAEVLPGKYIEIEDGGSGGDLGFEEHTIYFIPTDAEITTAPADTGAGAAGSMVITKKYQDVLLIPAIPAGTIIEYLGVLGDKVTIVEGSYTLSRGETKKINLGFRPRIVMLYRDDTNTDTQSDLVLTSSRYVAFDNNNQYSVEFTMLSDGFSTQWQQSREDDPYTIDYKAILGGLIE